ncbi:MAG TPA: LysR family transcriptional regulator [Caulobacteraceae bacterium]
MADFDWNDLRAFLAVARTGRLTAAAQRLGADHTTVARRVTALERALKAKLFDRSPAGYSLTPHGERLMPQAEAMESLAVSAQSEVGEADLSVSGVVRIGAPEGFGSYFLAPRMCDLAETHPDLEVQLVAMARAMSLSKREADMAVVLSPPREGRLVARKLTDYRLGLYGAPAYLDRRSPIRRRADLSQHRFIGYIEELLYAPELDYMQAPDVDISVRLKSSNLIAQLQACLAGAGLCVLPHFIAVQHPGLERVLPDKVSMTLSLWLLTHADLKTIARVKAVSDFLVEEVKKAKDVFLPD